MPTQTPVSVGKQVLAIAKKLDPKAEVLVDVVKDFRSHTRFARNEITTSGENDDWLVSVAVQLGQRAAIANSNQLDAGSLERMLERVLSVARLTPESPETMPVLGATKPLPSALHDPKMASLDPKARAEGVKAALEPSRRDDLMTAGYVEVHDGQIARLSSAGLEVSAAYTDANLSVTARTKDATGSGWHELATRKRAELDFEKVGRIAAQKAVASQKPTALEPGRYTVVLEAAAAAELWGHFFGALDRRSADEGRSAMSGKVGTKIINERFTVRSDPRTTPMLPFDGEGQALAARSWVERGVLKELYCSRFWAKKQGLQPTGGYDGFEVAPGDVAPEALLKGIKRGVLITRFWYSNFLDPQTLTVTALTRDGTFLIEDGAIVRPVKNFRINQSVLAAFSACDALGNVAEPVGTTQRVPAMRTHEFLLASTSDAV
ncbi:MAG: TldD/PmbA family protein [Myxococcaceae bacterium]